MKVRHALNCYVLQIEHASWACVWMTPGQETQRVRAQAERERVAGTLQHDPSINPAHVQQRIQDSAISLHLG